MKKLFAVLMISLPYLLTLSCDKDEGKLPKISFKSGGAYVSSDLTLKGGSALVIGIAAEKTEKRDVLKKFNISKSVNGGANTSIYDQNLSGVDGDNFSYDYSTTVDTTRSQSSKYFFTVTNRDGLVNQVSVTIVTQ